MWANRALPVVVCLVVAGCGQGPERSFLPLIAVDPARCVRSVHLEDATPVILGERETDKNEILFTETSPCVLQPDGSAANYHVFRLPPFDQSYLITLRTEPVGPAYLAITADIVAADGTVIRSVGADKFSFHGTSLVALLRSGPGEDYLVVRSDPSRVGISFDQISEASLLYSTTNTRVVTSRSGKTTSYSQIFTNPVGVSKDQDFVFSHNGSLHVTASVIFASK